MPFKFGDDRLRGLGLAEGQILPFPIDFDGRPYNTLTLSCECVILSQISRRVCQWKNFENPLRTDKVINISLMYYSSSEHSVYFILHKGG